jgi:hypothetical protein
VGETVSELRSWLDLKKLPNKSIAITGHPRVAELAAESCQLRVQPENKERAIAGPLF